MTEQDIIARVAELARGIVPEFEGAVTSSTRLLHDLDMDSLSRVDLLAEVERTFEVQVPDNQVRTLNSIGDVARFVASQHGG
jgi:acyl carrier protein